MENRPEINTDLVSYYKNRVDEYEAIYQKPERQEDLRQARTWLQQIFWGKNVLEIACGTGYWTEKIARAAASILATDINEAVIDIARQKTYSHNNVTFESADIFQYHQGKQHESLFGGFIWSHIPMQKLNTFLNTINGFVTPGGTIVLMDNNFVESSNTPIAETDEYGNTYQLRRLKDGTTHKVLKNFPTEAFLHDQLKDIASNVRVIQLHYYWILTYTSLP